MQRKNSHRYICMQLYNTSSQHLYSGFYFSGSVCIHRPKLQFHKGKVILKRTPRGNCVPKRQFRLGGRSPMKNKIISKMCAPFKKKISSSPPPTPFFILPWKLWVSHIRNLVKFSFYRKNLGNFCWRPPIEGQKCRSPLH